MHLMKYIPCNSKMNHLPDELLNGIASSIVLDVGWEFFNCLWMASSLIISCCLSIPNENNLPIQVVSFWISHFVTFNRPYTITLTASECNYSLVDRSTMKIYASNYPFHHKGMFWRFSKERFWTKWVVRHGIHEMMATGMNLISKQ